MGITVVVRTPAGGPTAQAEPPLSLAFDAPRVVIGRGDGCEVRLPDPSVSARHASLRQHGGSYLLVDEGSSNGTFIGGVRLAAHAPRVVTHGELVRVGRVWLEIRLEAVAQPSSPQATRELALSLVQRALSRSGEDTSPRLVVVAGPDEGRELLLLEPGRPYILGRGNGVDLMLDENDASRRHVQLTRRAEQLLVRDLGSKNGTFAGEQRLDPSRDAVLRSGDELRVGQDRFVYQNAAAEALAELERCADEPMSRDDESIDAPPDEGLPDPSPDQGAEAVPDGSTAASPGSPPLAGPSSLAGAPAVAPPRRQPAAPTRSGWGPSDVVIVLLALGVLTLSIGGLWMLFRG